MADTSGLKRKFGQAVKSKEHHIILHYVYLHKTQNAEKIVRWVANATAIIMGTSKACIFKLKWKQNKSTSDSTQAGKDKGTKILQRRSVILI
jgi:hypothetical protein